MSIVEPTAEDIRASRRKLLVLFAMPIIAIGLATLVYVTGFGIPKGTTNQGILLQPPVNFSDSPLEGTDGQPWRYPEENDWTLINVVPGVCGETCRERIFLTRQVRTALGKDAGRISRLLITTRAGLDPDLTSYIQEEHSAMQRAFAESPGLGQWLQIPDVNDPMSADLILLADKNGFVMMYYTPDQPGKDLLKDLKFLLKYSREKQR